MSLQNYAQLYQVLNPHHVPLSNILTEYASLPALNGSADQFFEKYGPGNTTMGMHRPFERMKTYEMLLELLRDHDEDHFHEIHKGTPYYFLGWTAFQIEDYSRANFYLDAAFSEDIRLINSGQTFDIRNQAHQTPAIKFLLLDQNAGHVAGASALQLRQIVQDEIDIFSTQASVGMNVDRFLDEFVLHNYQAMNNGFRTIITCFYAFIHEFHTRQSQMLLRSSEGGSIEPFITHLFKGGVILESLLKFLSPGDSVGTLKQAINAHATQLSIDRSLLRGGMGLPGIVQIMDQMDSDGTNYHNNCYSVAYALRNTTGHKLQWPDVFDEDVYVRLCRKSIGAILWTVSALWSIT